MTFSLACVSGRMYMCMLYGYEEEDRMSSREHGTLLNLSLQFFQCYSIPLACQIFAEVGMHAWPECNII